MASFPRRILVVDDEPELADLFTLWLTPDHAVETAYGGAEALERLGDPVDLVILDRRMPEVSGDDVLRAIRSRGIGCEVVMITGVDFDIETLSLDFDWYLGKPVTRGELLAVVDFLETKVSGGDDVREYCDLLARKTALESYVPRETLRAHDAYDDIVQSVASARETVTIDVSVPGT